MKKFSSLNQTDRPAQPRHPGKWLPICALLLAAFGLYIAHAGADSLWFDEAWSAYAAGQPGLIAAANADATNPPLYYALLHLHVQAAGDSEFALRFFSAAWALIAAALTSQLARRLYRSSAAVYTVPTALCFALFLPLMVWATREARMYTFMAALVAVAALSLHRLFQQTRALRWAWAAVLGAELALLYTHNTGPVVALWLNVAVALAWLGGWRNNPSRSRFHPPLITWGGGQLLVLVLWFPYFLTRFLLVAGANDAVTSAPALSPALLSSLWAAFWRPAAGGTFVSEAALSPLIVVPLLLIVAVVVDWRRPASRWLGLHILLLVGGIVAALIVLRNEMHARYLVLAVPLLAALLAGSVVRWGRAGRALLLASFAFAVVFALQGGFSPHDDARGMARYYAGQLSADDSVLMWSYADRYDLAYYWPRESVSARRITLPEGADLEQIVPLLPTSGDIALNVWYTQRADYRGMMGCLLGDGTREAAQEYTVSGMTNRLYRQPSLRLPTLRPADITFSHSSTPVARLEQVGELPVQAADSALCVPLRLALLAPYAGDLKAALTVRNSLGMEIAHTDAIFATADQRTTHQLAGDAPESLDAYALLRLPTGTPAGSYRVFVRVYDELNDSSGLVPAAQSPQIGVISGRDVALGEWRVREGAWAGVLEASALEPSALFTSDALSLLDLRIDLPDAGSARSGDRATVTLVWRRAPGVPLPALTLRDTLGRWSVVLAPGEAAGPVVREWRTFQIPIDAPVGEAALMLPDGTVLATLPVSALPYLDQAPAYALAVEQSFPDLGQLVGVTFPPAVTPDTPFEVTLIWQAGQQPAATDYTVFVQLLDAQGQVAAQSDQTPAGNRATTGWRADEYLSDVHLLRWNLSERAPEWRLIAGWYDPVTGQRVLTPTGEDHVVLGNIAADS